MQWKNRKVTEGEAQLANKYTERSPTSLVTGNRKINTTLPTENTKC